MSAPTQFRKKPVVISAIQWTGENLVDVIHFTDGRPPNNKSSHAGMMWDQYVDVVRKDGLKIFTMEGKMDASIGDWIIKGVKGEHYPCKPEIFALTYEDANARTDLSQASVAAALEAAAVKSDDMATEWGKKREAAWRKKNATEEARVFDGMSLAALTVADAIRALITPAQHDALAAHVAAAVAEARAADAVKLAFPADVLEFALKIGRAEWGQTDPKTAAEHATDMASTVEKTAAYFGQTEPQSLNGLYIEGTGIVICHTGVSPNSPEIARILTWLWNMIYDTAQIGAKP